MPSTSESQRRAFGMALALKRGTKVKASPAFKKQLRKMASTMSEAQLQDFARSVQRKKR